MKNSSQLSPEALTAFRGSQCNSPELILRMLRIAAQRSLAGYPDRLFQPVSSFFYNDSTPILTLTGVVCPRR